MFNLIQDGNRIDITSSGIDFRITGTYVSGSSYMIANIEAVGYDWDVYMSASGTLANVKLHQEVYGTLRTSYISSSADDGFSVCLVNDFSVWDASGLEGHTGTLVGYVDGSDISSPTMRPGSILSYNDHIFTQSRLVTGSHYVFEVSDFDMTSGSSQVLDFGLSDYEWVGTGEQTWIQLIDEREVFAFDIYDSLDSENTADHEGGQHFYIANFTTNSKTEALTVWTYDGGGWNGLGADGYTHYYQYERRVKGIFTIKDIYANVHLLVLESYYDWDRANPYGIGVWHSINGGDFEEHVIFRSQLDNANWGISLWFSGVISSKRYLSASAQYISNAGETEITIMNITYDVLSSSLTYAEQGPYSVYQYWYSCVEDITTGRTFVNASIDGVHAIYEYSPVNMLFDVEGVVGGDDYLLASKTTAYRWTSADKIIRLIDDTEISTYTRPAYMQNVSMIIDDDNTIWFIEGTHLMGYNIDTESLDKDFNIGAGGSPLLVHIGSRFVVAVISGKFVYYYLVT